MTTGLSPIPMLRPQEPYLLGQLRNPTSSAYAVAHLIFYSADGLTGDMVYEGTAQAIEETDSIHYFLEQGEDGEWRNVPGTKDERSHTYLDLSEEADPEVAFRARVRESWEEPIPITGPTVSYRSFVAKLGPERYAWFGGCHHAALDGYGGMLLRRRASELIAAAVAGVPAPECRTGTLKQLAAEPRVLREESVQYWLSQLEGAPRHLSFTDRVAAPANLPRISATSLPNTALGSLIAGTKLSWRDVAAALVLSYIAAFTQVDTAVVGFPVSGRHTDVAKVVHSATATTLPLQLRFEHGDTLLDVAARFRAALKQSYAHQDILISDIFDASPAFFRKPRIFGPLLNIIPFHDDIAYGTLTTEYEVWSHGPIDDFSFTMEPKTPTALSVELLGNPALYSQEECDAHAQRFTRWSEQLLSDAHLLLDDAQALTEQEAALHNRLATLEMQPSEERDDVKWGDILTPEQLAARAALAPRTKGLTGLRLVGAKGRPTPQGVAGRVLAITASGEVDTGFLAAISGDNFVYRGLASERVQVGEYDVEKGAIVEAVRAYVEQHHPDTPLDTESIAVEEAKSSLTVTLPWAATEEDLRALREEIDTHTPARIRLT
ncbi:Dimodular nonribosomal peptide synthase [Corynebacterium capitovis DSM 44611]|uniref:condensation domain-containing protein n=1 Tax=Corynebacterium capitovis TaxID=131081 RepID=UPI00035D187D|nr:condensation domain-containing protein [Corynebacterium capitovis]WKD57208.1 Dimodular nonribosomal peptide synthase [Corynebacterium capitovis DSM 44611]